jgi:hypothetical protein
MTREFDHYDSCKHRDPDNCSGCALTTGGEDGPNYAGWPLAYMANKRTIPAKWFSAFQRELASGNRAYADNIKQHILRYGVGFR